MRSERHETLPRRQTLRNGGGALFSPHTIVHMLRMSLYVRSCGKGLNKRDATSDLIYLARR